MTLCENNSKKCKAKIALCMCFWLYNTMIQIFLFIYSNRFFQFYRANVVIQMKHIFLPLISCKSFRKDQKSRFIAHMIDSNGSEVFCFQFHSDGFILKKKNKSMGTNVSHFTFYLTENMEK